MACLLAELQKALDVPGETKGEAALRRGSDLAGCLWSWNQGR